MLLPLAASLLLASEFLIPGVDGPVEVKIRNQQSSTATVRVQLADAEPLEAEILPGQTSQFSFEGSATFLRVRSNRAVVIAARRPNADLPVFGVNDYLEPNRPVEIPWLGPVSLLWLYLENDSAATLLLRDAAGEEVETQSITGSGLRIIALSGAAARARLTFTKGRGLAFFEVRDPESGDAAAARPIDPKRIPATQVLSPALRQLRGENALLRTDLRLVNPHTTPLTVTLVYDRQAREVLLAPRESRDFPDLLNSVFEKTEDTQGTLLVTASPYVIALARLAVNARSAFHPLEALSALELPGESFVALPASNASHWLFTRNLTDAASALFRSWDADGLTLYSSPAPVELAAQTPRWDSFRALLGLDPAGTETLGAAFEFSPATGVLGSTLISLDNETLDPRVAGFASGGLPVVCSAPSIARFDAVGNRLFWEVSGADLVLLSPLGGEVAATGSLTVSTGGAFRLKASNSCGESEVQAFVGIGVPVLKSLQRDAAPAGAAGSGAPGQLLELRFDNLGSDNALDFLIARYANGAERVIPILYQREDGYVVSRIPYSIDNKAGGQVQLRAQTITGQQTAALPFTITPLSFAGDPLAGFNRFLTNLSANTAKTIADLRTVGGLDSLITVQERIIAADLAFLRQVATDLAANRPASLTFGNGNTPAVTRADLADFLALNQNMIASEAELERIRYATPHSALGTCLAVKRPLIPICKAAKIRERLEAAAANAVGDFYHENNIPPAAQNQAQTSIQNWVKEQLNKSGLHSLIKRASAALTAANIACLIYPVVLRDFTAEPNFIPFSTHSNQATAVKIFAELEAITNRNKIADWKEAQEAKAFAQALRLKGMANAAVQAATQAFLNAANFDLDRNLASLALGFANARPTDRVQVGNCDLNSVYPSRNAPAPGQSSYSFENPNFGYKEGYSRLYFATSRPFGQDDYYLLGMRPGPEKLCIQPNKFNFLFRSDLEVAVPPKALDRCAYHAFGGVSRSKSTSRSLMADEMMVDYPWAEDVSVGEDQPRLTLIIENTDAGLNDANRENRFIPGEPNVSSGFSRKVQSGLGLASLRLTRTGQWTWSLEMEAEGFLLPIGNGVRDPYYGSTRVAIGIHNPETLNNDQKIKLSASISGDSQCLKSLGLRAGQRFAGASGIPGAASYEIEEPLATSGQLSASLDAAVGAELQSIRCTVKGTIELIR